MNTRNPIVILVIIIIVIIILALLAYFLFGDRDAEGLPGSQTAGVVDLEGEETTLEDDPRVFCEKNGGIYTNGICSFHGFDCDAVEFMSGECVPELGPKG